MRIPVTTGRCLVLWLAQAIVSGARSGASNGSREHTSEKRRKDRRCGRLGSVRHLIISFARSPICFSREFGSQWAAISCNARLNSGSLFACCRTLNRYRQASNR